MMRAFVWPLTSSCHGGAKPPPTKPPKPKPSEGGRA